MAENRRSPRGEAALRARRRSPSTATRAATGRGRPGRIVAPVPVPTDFGEAALRKIILMMSVSLDGFIEGPERQLDWHRVDDELHTHFNDEIRSMGGLLEGRVTYELMAGVWPTAEDDPASTAPMREFARIWLDMPKFVFSRTLERADWNTTLVREVVPEEIRALKAQPGGDLVVGGPDLAASFLRHDLVDEFRVYVHPVLIGRGRRLFPPFDAIVPLRLAESRAFGNGVVLLRYERDV